MVDGVLKLFDCFVINYFYMLEGCKFLMSLCWVIWVEDFVVCMCVLVDVVCGFVVLINLVVGCMDFDCDVFCWFVNGLYVMVCWYVVEVIGGLFVVCVLIDEMVWVVEVVWCDV